MGPFLQDTLRRVFPRDWRILFVHIAMAADSFAAAPRPERSLTVFRTFFTHPQNLAASRLDLVCAIYLCIIIYRYHSEMQGLQLNRLTHTKDDSCGIEQYYKQSVGPGAYTTTNLVPDARDVNPLAAKELLVYAREGFGSNNKQIDSESVLKNQPEFNNQRCNIRAQARPFLGVPYMGGGRGNAEVETLLLHSEQVRMGKECGTVTETQFDGVFTPMIPTVKNNIQKPENLITEMASPGWIRGGLPSRSYIRDVNC